MLPNSVCQCCPTRQGGIQGPHNRLIESPCRQIFPVVGPTRCGREGRTRPVREVKKVKHENCIQSNATKKRRRKLHQQLPCFCKPSSRNTTNTSIDVSDKKLRKFNKDKTRLHPIPIPHPSSSCSSATTLSFYFWFRSALRL